MTQENLPLVFYLLNYNSIQVSINKKFQLFLQQIQFFISFSSFSFSPILRTEPDRNFKFSKHYKLIN